MKDPLVGPVAAIASGILVSRFVPFHQFELVAAIGAFFLLGILALYRKARFLSGLCCMSGLFLAGALTALAHSPGPAPTLDVEGREVVILGGCVVEPPAISSGRERFLLELDPGARAQVTLYTKKDGEALPALRYGQNIELDARVRKPRNYGNPGAFDYAHYLARTDIYWTASGAADSVRILPGHCGKAFAKQVMDLRAAMIARIDRIWGASSYQDGMMQAILLGQTFQMQRVWTEDYRNTGTFHALVISGTHVAILAAFFLFILRVCFVPESLALLMTVLAAWLYALVSGWGAPCVRSAAGLTLYMAGSYFYRDRRPVNLLAAVALGFLLFDPEQLFEASFQLTFLAVAFLGVFAMPFIAATTGPLARGLTDLGDTARDLHLEPRVAQFRIEMRLLAETLRGVLRVPLSAARGAVALLGRVLFFFFEVTVVSAVIQIGLALPMVVYFHRVGLSGLSANALVVPVMGLVVPVGFVALATGWMWVARVSGWLLWVSQEIVRWHASVEPNWRIPTPPLWVALAFSAALIAAAVARGRWCRLAAGLAVAATLAVLLWSPFPPEQHRGQLELTAIDVGQGDSLLVVFPDGKLLLLDGGGIPVFGRSAKTQLDIGEDVVAPYLWQRGMRTVDVIVLSHAHEDHVGGLPALVSDFRPKELWTGPIPESPTWHEVRERAARNRSRIVPLTVPSRFAFGGAEIQVLAPLPDYVPGDTPKNNDSLVLRVRYGRHSFLLCGDAERQVERGMLEAGEIEASDVLKVGHHGSRTSSTEEFLAAVHPAFALISVGVDNSYGHPNRDVVDRLGQHGAAVLRTDKDGLITVRTDGRRLYMERYHDGAAGPQTAAPWGF
ncbi:MAG: ComEC/Rec2 family competence protein [Candidatus Sulfopaludibacter sp.]|nr:ComEC/Rec2 family competence protein [Candidatus Sulfopaludibacter sp.]